MLKLSVKLSQGQTGAQLSGKMLSDKICGMIAAADQVVPACDCVLRFAVRLLLPVTTRAPTGNGRRSPVAGCADVANGLNDPASNHICHGQVHHATK